MTIRPVQAPIPARGPRVEMQILAAAGLNARIEGEVDEQTKVIGFPFQRATWTAGSGEAMTAARSEEPPR